MASEKGKAAFEYMKNYMQKNAKATYGETRDAAKKGGHVIFPIMYGRAQALLGRVKVAKRGTGKFATKQRAVASGTAMPKRRGRPPGSKNKSTLARIAAGGISGGGMPATGKRRGRPPGSKNKSTLARMAGGGSGGYRMNGHASLSIGNADLANAQAIVDAVNGGGRLALRYEAGAWVIAAG